MTLAEIRQYYADLIIWQYRIKPKAIDTVKLLVDQAICDDIFTEIQNAFDVDTAVGDQLTILGRTVGVNREVLGLDLSHTYFSFTDYVGSPASIGFGDYTDSPYGPDLFYDYFDYASYVLTDFELRFLIKMKIIFNNMGPDMGYVADALWAAFGTDVQVLDGVANAADYANTYFNFTDYNGVPDSNGFGDYTDSPYPTGYFYDYDEYMGMTITYNVASVYENAFTAGLYLEIIPKPMAVGVLVNYV